MVVAGAGAMPSAIQASAEGEQPLEYIVVLRQDANLNRTIDRHTERQDVNVTHVYEYALKGYAAMIEVDDLQAVRSDPAVLFVTDAFDPAAGIGRVVPRSITRDGAAASTHGLAARAVEQPSQVTKVALMRIGADRSSALSGNGRGDVDINVAVLDTGIQPNHPDLDVKGGRNCTPGGVNNWRDPDGHGTMVAGFVGALDNEIGVVGVAPGANLYAVKVSDPLATNPEFEITDAALVCGLDWVASTHFDGNKKNDIDVANLSLGGTTYTDDDNCGRTARDAVHFAICGIVAAGVVPVAAATNEGEDFARTSPATYDEVLTVTAIAAGDAVPGGLAGILPCLLPDYEQRDDEFAFFSDFFTTEDDAAHTVAAPGVCMTSTFIGSQYAFGSGTSFATPLVTGTVALCISSGTCKNLTPQQIVRKIVLDARAYNEANPDYGFLGDPIRPVPNKSFGYLINAALY